MSCAVQSSTPSVRKLSPTPPLPRALLQKARTSHSRATLRASDSMRPADPFLRTCRTRTKSPSLRSIPESSAQAGPQDRRVQISARADSRDGTAGRSFPAPRTVADLGHPLWQGDGRSGGLWEFRRRVCRRKTTAAVRGLRGRACRRRRWESAIARQPLQVFSRHPNGLVRPGARPTVHCRAWYGGGTRCSLGASTRGPETMKEAGSLLKPFLVEPAVA
jgi:hypothetical protein